MSKLAIAAVAPKIANAQPKTASAVVNLVKTVLLPLLPFILTEILAADKTGKAKKSIKAIRDVVDQMDLG